MNPAIRTEVHDRILLITLDRPARKNAVNEAMAGELAQAIDDLDADPRFAAAVLTGAGDTFCSGLDLKAFLEGERPIVPERGFAGIVRRPPDKPICAAVEGAAMAGGFEIALSCDMAVAAEDAVFGLPEVKRGLAAGGGGVVRLAQRVSRAIALEIVLTGDSIDAARAYELGLVNAVAERGGAVERAMELMRRVAGNAPLALRASKDLVNDVWAASEEDLWSLQQQRTHLLMETSDAREGARAFAERRAPVWTGR